MSHLSYGHETINFRPKYKDGDHCKLFGHHTYRKFFIGDNRLDEAQLRDPKNWQEQCTGCWKTKDELENQNSHSVVAAQ
jgi:hypothetical protein